MKQKFESCFLISHIKKAIWDLECANKLIPNTVDEKHIEDLKLLLIELGVKSKGGVKNA